MVLKTLEHNETVGKRIRQNRIAKNISQIELAGKLGISPQAVSRWELGRSLPHAEKLLRLSEILEITVEELMK